MRRSQVVLEEVEMDEYMSVVTPGTCDAGVHHSAPRSGVQELLLSMVIITFRRVTSDV